MGDLFLIWLLSIASNLSGVLSTIAILAIIIACVTYAAGWLITFLGVIDNNDDFIEKSSKAAKIVEPKARKYAITFFVIFAFCKILSSLFPDPKSVLIAYAIVEGSKVVNAENAEIAAQDASKKFDKLLDIVDEAWNGEKPTKKEEPKPVETKQESPKQEETTQKE